MPRYSSQMAVCYGRHVGLYPVQLCAVLVAVVTLVAILPQSRADVFTAIVELEGLLDTGSDLATELRKYIALEEARISDLKKVADEYERSSLEATSDPETFLSNPVNAFLLVKRYTTDWKVIQETYIRHNLTNEFLERISTRSTNFPTSEDLTGAASALFRIQDTYDLTTDEVARGELKGVNPSPQLTAEECFELGRQANEEADHYHALMWLDEAMSRLERENPATISKALVLDYYSYAMARQGNFQRALILTDEWLHLEPNKSRASDNKKILEKLLTMKAAKNNNEEELNTNVIHNKRIPLDDYRAGDEFHRYEKLCRGEQIQPLVRKDRLGCHFKRHHPMFFIDPLREETLSLDPWIVMYHNVLSEKEMQTIRELATPKLLRSKVHSDVTEDEGSKVDYRISKSGILYDEDDKVTSRVSLKTSAITNNTLEYVEPLQVVNYGIGGHYEPHLDFQADLEPGDIDSWGGAGNRILTAIYYLSDVIAGGYTVFPDIGVAVPPAKGSCAVWYNLFANGTGDRRTVHGGCPVFTGTKWVANKWFHEKGQEFVRRCDLNPLL